MSAPSDGMAACRLARSRAKFRDEDKLPLAAAIPVGGSELMHQDFIARWRSATGAGLEHCRIAQREDGTEVQALVIAPEGFAARYRLRCDAGWRVRAAQVVVLGKREGLALRSDGVGHWTGDGPLARLGGAVDIDISMTPFTNTLPIRRLGLAVGAAAEIDIAYVDMPSLTVSRRPQRYTRLAERLWRFETLDMDFSAEITVDGAGLVLDYPGLFEREG